MDISNSRQAILPAAEVADLCRRSDAAGFVRLGAHAAVLAALIVIVQTAVGSWWVWPAMLAQGIVQVALFAGLHECVHRTAFESRRYNDVAASAIGLILALPAGFFRRFHFAHHRHTQDPANDPELMAAKPATMAQYAAYLSGFYYWRDRSRELVRHAAGRVEAGFIPAAERPAVVREARWHLAVYAAAAALVLAGISDLPLMNWLLPAMLGQPFLRAYLLAEHTGCPECPDMLANTRTTCTNAITRFLMWNMPYHTEHHVFPAVPFHALPALHAKMQAQLVETSAGYAAFHRAYGQALRAGDGEAFVHPPLPAAS